MQSIWQEDSSMPTFAPLLGDSKVDVLIIGGGMAGLLCAHQLQAAGIDCAVVEAASIAGGTTGGTTAKITSQHGLIYHKLVKRFGVETAGLYWKANEQALSALRTLCAGIDCGLSSQDSFIYSKDNREILETELRALEQIGGRGELAENLPLPFSTVGAVKFSHQAQFHPLKFLSAIARNLTIYENTPVRRVERGRAWTDHGVIRADNILITTHFPFLNKHGSYFLKLYQQRSYALALENAPDLEGMYLDARENGLSFRCHDGRLILGGGGHRTGKSGGGWKELADFAAGHYPEARITHRWAAQDCMSLDGIPYIGQYSRHTPGIYTATGFNKWGMTSSMVAAQLLTDLVQGKENPYVRVFSPSRSILRPQLFVNAGEALMNLLTPTAKRCTHMGCALKWNPAEHTWDCPCHGSRFEETGKIIDNPATKQLNLDSQ